MKLLIIVPRYNLTSKISYSYSFPVGLGYISSVLKKAGYDVDCLNFNHHNGSIEEIMSSCLNKNHYDIICTGQMAIGYQVIKKIIDSVRNNSRKSKVVIGGGNYYKRTRFDV